MNDAKLKTKTKQQIFYIEARHTVIRPDGQATQLEMRAIEFSALPPPPPSFVSPRGLGRLRAESAVVSLFLLLFIPLLSLSLSSPPPLLLASQPHREDGPREGIQDFATPPELPLIYPTC